MSEYLVLGAELLCTKCKKSGEVSLLMACADNINNALLHGMMVANRRNREERKDIIPFEECKKSAGFLSGNETCDAVIKTEQLWENLTLPFDDVRIPSISFDCAYETGFLKGLFGMPVAYGYFSVSRKVNNLNSGVDETRFLDSYDAEKRRNNSSGGYALNDQEIRHVTNLKMHSKIGQTSGAGITVDSILLCTGYGGIIHPKTSGQSPVYSKNMWQLALSLPADQISQEAYEKLARLFLFTLGNGERATFISLCFDFKERVENTFLTRLGGVSIECADVWSANQEKFNQLISNMGVLAAEDEYRNLNLLHRYLLFDSAQYIQRPTSEIGASGPAMSISYQPTPFPSYILDYKEYYIDDYTEPFINSTVFTIRSYNATVYRPSNGDNLMELHSVLQTQKINELSASPYGGVVGFARDTAISLTLELLFTRRRVSPRPVNTRRTPTQCSRPTLRGEARYHTATLW
ncbi:MAG: hypothetical protein LBH28_10835, partial [Oscillospiraceae bacterium]|nr:hypothetical protein [Oscillospiraceae bacterium]